MRGAFGCSAAALGRTWLLGCEGTSWSTVPAPFRAALQRGYLGGVILFARNVESPLQLQRFIAQLHAHAGHPIWVAVDHEGGHVTRLPAEKGFGVTIPWAEVATWDNERIQRYANTQARLLADLGINLNFAPVVDLAISTQSPIIVGLGRSAGREAADCVRVAQIWSQSHAQYGIAYCWKHFPGHGSAHTDTHVDHCVDITDTWQEAEHEPYHALVQHGPLAHVMMAHVVHRTWDPRALPASFSAPMVHLLRHTIGFPGIIWADDLHMASARVAYPRLQRAWQAALQAGVDGVIAGHNLPVPSGECIADPIQYMEDLWLDVQHNPTLCARIVDSNQRFTRSLHACSAPEKMPQ